MFFTSALIPNYIGYKLLNSIMLKQSPGRNLRSKGFKVKHAFQIGSLIVVVIWLRYHSNQLHDHSTGAEEITSVAPSDKALNTSRILNFGRKHLQQTVEETKIAVEDERLRGEEDPETNGGNEMEAQMEEEHPEDEEEEVVRLEAAGGGDDEIDGLDQFRYEVQGSGFYTDEEDETEDYEDEEDEEENVVEDAGFDSTSQGLQEDQYRTDDALSEVHNAPAGIMNTGTGLGLEYLDLQNVTSRSSVVPETAKNQQLYTNTTLPLTARESNLQEKTSTGRWEFSP